MLMRSADDLVLYIIGVRAEKAQKKSAPFLMLILGFVAGARLERATSGL